MDAINELLNMLVWFVLGYFAARLATNALKNYLLSKIEDPEREALVGKIMEMLHRVKKEQHGEIHYWFDEDSDMFLAQGRIDEEIKEHLKQRFKGHIFLIDDKNALAGPELKLTPISDLAMKDGKSIS